MPRCYVSAEGIPAIKAIENLFFCVAKNSIAVAPDGNHRSFPVHHSRYNDSATGAVILDVVGNQAHRRSAQSSPTHTDAHGRSLSAVDRIGTCGGATLRTPQ